MHNREINNEPAIYGSGRRVSKLQTIICEDCQKLVLSSMILLDRIILCANLKSVESCSSERLHLEAE